MYGYFRPYDSDLNDKHRRIFQAYYCRLCYCLWLYGGQSARYFTTFDLTLYSMIIHLSVGAKTPDFYGCERVFHTIRDHFKGDEIGEKLARLSFITFGEKFRDDMLDEGGIKNFIKRLFFQKKIRKACAEAPELARLAYEGTEAINRLQEQGADLDALLDRYADAMEDTVSALEEIKPEYIRLFRALARWTYFVDILCDYDEDAEKDQYNPLRKQGYLTLQEYFAHNYYSLMNKNREIAHEVHAALEGCRTDRPEWDALFKIIVYSLETVVPNILKGTDVTFHYFKELRRNRQRIAEEKKAMRKKRDYETR